MNLLFGFQGRIGRLQWWLGQLAGLVWIVIVMVVLSQVVGAVNIERLAEGDAAGVGGSFVLFVLAALIPTFWINLATTIKRYHDRDKSGFWFLMNFVPYIGGIWILVECGFLSGTPGGNSYGVRGEASASFEEDWAELDAQNLDSIDRMISQRKAQIHTNAPAVQRTRNPGNNNGRPTFGQR